MSRISLIAAVARNNVIGSNQTIPWHIPSDFAWFKQTTMGKPMIMGRKQFETFARPLPGRPHIVVTRQHDYAPEGVIVRRSLPEAMAAARRMAEASELDEIMVIGGGDIYAQALPLADRLYVSHVDLAPEGDVHFPAIDPQVWEIVAEPDVPRSEKDGASYSIAIYERVHAAAH
ncbi:MAG: diacylglycerol kinase [Pelagibacterium sp. SCN 63-23]|nr:MAG: diacylglycerol kinase [Pelagibacterium sp. SCN 63-23]